MAKRRLTLPVALIGLTVLVSTGCAQEVRTVLVQHQFAIGDRSFSISLPPEFQRNPNVPFVEFRTPRERTDRYLRFTAEIPSLEGSHNQIRLRQGGKLRFSVITSGVGSGGTEVELFGFIVLDSKTIGINAHDQDEFSPNPKWCIEYLHTLRVK
ncbi:hypothetical protein KR51_00023530 [Rubidibacter lacunae KORDI 51-2]|uniref:Type six secretion immunity 3 domain-containing protein n=2 Tax=Rubidibacter TaxID=582491 RepID=U5DJM6_9CHRO|nr:hypothetical protein KR51_00023530 [Rubidibacter lacunae KORDI 51-2]